MDARNADPPDFEVFKTVFYYCFTIIFLPVVTFFCTKFLLLDCAHQVLYGSMACLFLFFSITVNRKNVAYVLLVIVFGGFTTPSIIGLESMPSNVYSAIAAVIVIHIALGMYIYRAYSETPPGKSPSKVD